MSNMNSGGFGPNCPACGTSAEWTEFEIQEPIYAPKTYYCGHCFKLYILSVEKVEEIQSDAKNILAGCSTPESKETEQDWQRARYEWENPPD